VGDFAETSPVLRPAAGFYSGCVFTESHIKDIVKRVLNTPMGPDRAGKEFGVGGQGGDKIPLFDGYFLRGFANRFDNTKRFDSVPVGMAFRKPGDIA
jgi:hypothetical protein